MAENTRVGPDLLEVPLEEDDYDDEWACTWCGGDGYTDDLNPLEDNCDEHGYGPCPCCNGTGERKHQTIF